MIKCLNFIKQLVTKFAENGFSDLFCLFVEENDCFSSELDPRPPSLQNQLERFRKFMAMGTLVFESIDSWLRVSDREGVASDWAQEMAELYQVIVFFLYN